MNAPKQMLLDLQVEWTPTLENYVAGSNRELISRLRGLADPRCFDAVYVWGSEGCGKSHLLNAVSTMGRLPRTILSFDGLTAPAEIPVKPGSLLLIDNVQNLSAEAQIGLFRLFNSARILGLSFFLTGPCAPLQLTVREDLRTRIGQCMIYEVQNLTDDEKKAALQRHARLRGMRLDDNVVHYLLRHGRRNLPSLMAVLDTLDRISLEQKRQATVPLLRELLQTSLNLDPK
jgi:DnaA family protein